MKIVTAITFFNDAVGKRMHIVYSKVDDNTGKVLSDNSHVDRLVIDSDAQQHIDALKEFAQTFVDAMED